MQIAQRQFFYCDGTRLRRIDSRSRRSKQRVMIGLIIDAIVRRLKPVSEPLNDCTAYAPRLMRKLEVYCTGASKSLSAARKLSTCCRIRPLPLTRPALRTLARFGILQEYSFCCASQSHRSTWSGRPGASIKTGTSPEGPADIAKRDAHRLRGPLALNFSHAGGIVPLTRAG